VTERGATHAQVNRPLLGEFAGVLAGMEWDLALLQEAPPRWLRPLGERCGASGVSVRTSRNTLAPLRAWAAELNPDLIASNEGGSNQVLVRAPWRVAEVRDEVLTKRPERRVVALVRVAAPGGAELCAGCLHASRGPRDAARDVSLAAEVAGEWAGSRPLVLGGDFNVRPEEDAGLYAALERRHGLRPALGKSIDQLLARGLEPVARTAALAPDAREVGDGSGRLLRLSDHPMVAASFSME